MQESRPIPLERLGPPAPNSEPAVPRSVQRPPAAVDACLRAIERVEQVLDQETYALKRHERADLAEFNHRKSHGLLELTRAMRSVGEGGGDPLEPRLRALQAKLRENSAVLRMHLEAVQEISAVMARAIRDGDSDGTYSAAIRFPGEKQ